MNTPQHIRALIKRLARLDAAETWESDLNPAQVAALDYLARANRFSRAPSHVAEYLGATRGTTSQTLKALVRKGYVSEHRSETDKRSISYDLTDAGRTLASQRGRLLATIEALPNTHRAELSETLSKILESQLAKTDGRLFGVCKTCTYHRTQNGHAYCALLSLPLLAEETEQICHEQVAA